MRSPYFETSEDKEWVIREYETFKKQNQPTFIAQTLESFYLLFFEVPLFEKMWIVFSIILPVMALKKREGIQQAIWILPLLTMIYCIDNQKYGMSQREPADRKLFPSEKELLGRYIKEPFQENILSQHKQLREGWEYYLIENWAKEEPSLDKNARKAQVQRADLEFSLARLRLSPLHMPSFREIFYKRQSLGFLVMYMIWNILVAWQVSRKEKHISILPA
jgi:uncharacterized membrane protein YqaE (UPF0057 family)